MKLVSASETLRRLSKSRASTSSASSASNQTVVGDVGDDAQPGTSKSRNQPPSLSAAKNSPKIVPVPVSRKTSADSKDPQASGLSDKTSAVETSKPIAESSEKSGSKAGRKRPLLAFDDLFEDRSRDSTGRKIDGSDADANDKVAGDPNADGGRTKPEKSPKPLEEGGKTLSPLPKKSEISVPAQEKVAPSKADLNSSGAPRKSPNRFCLPPRSRRNSKSRF